MPASRPESSDDDSDDEEDTPSWLDNPEPGPELAAARVREKTFTVIDDIDLTDKHLFEFLASDVAPPQPTEAGLDEHPDHEDDEDDSEWGAWDFSVS